MRLGFALFLISSFPIFAADQTFEQQATETFIVEQIKQTNPELRLAHEFLIARGYEAPNFGLEPSATKALAIGGKCNSLAEKQCDLRYLVVTTYRKGVFEPAALMGLVSLSSPKARGTLLRTWDDGELVKLLR